MISIAEKPIRYNISIRKITADPRIVQALTSAGYVIMPDTVKGRAIPLAIVRAGGKA